MMVVMRRILALGSFALLVVLDSALSQTVNSGRVLTPPYFNLAEGRRITASATCGYGISEPELYCKLVGAHADQKDNPNVNLIQGQVCDYCDPNNPDLDHSPENAIDGTEKWWQSPPLSRGTSYNNVNFTIDLGQEFHVAYVFIKMANSPRPGIWALERSTDHGKTWDPWQFFADTFSDCLNYFGRKSLEPITRDDSVICETKFSKIVPLEGGEIVVSLLNDRPSASNFYNSTILQEWTKATNIRLRLIRTKTLLGHLMSVARQDPTVTRRYYYSIRDISIGGRCVCNGHAETCDITDPEDKYKLLCRCQHNTCGSQCEKCCPGFVQKKWQPATITYANECEECNCFGHSDECEYDEEVDHQRLSLDKRGNYEGGGVCQNCQHNTEGINCNKCKAGFYRPYGKLLNATDVCQPCQCNVFYSTGSCAEGSGQCECRKEFLPPLCDKCNIGYYDYPNCKPCDCHLNGTRGFICEVGGGQCPCKPNYAGKNCDQCVKEYYNFPECTACDCNPASSVSPVCDAETGQCTCQNNFGGRTCSDCDNGFYNYPTCIFCNCDRTGCIAEVCNKTSGECLCKEGFGGPQCDRCAPGYYGYPNCKSCDCNDHGSVSKLCDESGRCQCLHNFAGLTCRQCAAGYYKYPDCLSCECDSAGAVGISCEKEGHCKCKPNFDGITCNTCKQGFYNYPSCEECNCNPAGVLPTFAGCGTLTTGELCQCKDRVGGRACNQCRALYWNLQPYNPLGCEECNCFVSGTIGGIGVCDGTTGQCLCKPNTGSRQCNECKDGTYSLHEGNLFGCIDCGCDIGGSVNQVCDKQDGQCACRPRISGRSCNEPLQFHYFPTLYQLQYEIEDGHTPANTPVRFGYNEAEFPGYSWRGYAVFSPLQKEVRMRIYIEKPSIYRVILHFFNKNSESVKGQITFTPDTLSGEIQQSSAIKFEVHEIPQLKTVSGLDNLSPSHFVLNPGWWTASIKVEKSLFLDYFVLLPAAYYEATLLHDVINIPCTVDDQSSPCHHYAYPEINDYANVRGEAGYIAKGDERIPTLLYTNYQLLEELGGEMAHLNQTQQDVHLEMTLPKSGRYVIVVLYFTPENRSTATLHVDTRSTTGRQKGRIILNTCRLTTLCRQAVTDAHGRVIVFNFDQNAINLHFKITNEADVAIDSVVAVPAKHWHTDYINPKVACLRIGGNCTESKFNVAPGFIKIEAETGNEEQTIKRYPNSDNDAKLIYLDHKESMVDIHGRVPKSGLYVFVVHYYQPRYPEFDLDVLIQNGQFYEGSLPVPFCPSKSGCRSVVRSKSGETKFQILETFVLTLKEPNHKSVLVDYIMIIPADSYKNEVLHEMPLDRAIDFITMCGQHHFYVDPESDKKGFCEEAIFSLTAEYNNGGLSCECDIDGSLSADCEKFGGQCNCLPNVIGRTCSECQTGYFGFPNCQPCNCPSTALCHPTTGDCICPPRVTGEKCDLCISNTYGFDPIIGCEECNCSPLGVNRGDLQCNLLTGECNCKPNVVGRTCDLCQSGYWSFPYCQLCDCDLRGTTEDICDMDTAQCFCKENVYGPTCDLCKPGSFHLEEKNALGCSKCFCFGRTDRCSSSTMFRLQISRIENWSTVLLQQGTLTVTEGESSLITNVDENRLVAQVSKEFLEDVLLYFSAPSPYLGNKITSYGGILSFILKFNVRSGKSSPLLAPDVIFVGNNMTLLYQHFEQPSLTDLFSMEVEIAERGFYHLNGGPVSREQLLVTLSNLEALYIRGSYFTSSKEISMKRVLLDIAVSELLADAPQALNVEQCHCPPNYQGSSCEDCAPGYYRSPTGPYGGYCIPCQCHGHSSTCDSLTGKCINCKHNTTGDHCETCSSGFHGDATKGTPYDCLICACPLPIASNNFAVSCEFSESGREIRCECKHGYYGPRCNYCAAGFYGQPEVEGETCKPCQCSGNIDAESFGSCDSLTGDCLVCLNNTFGPACELCAPGFFGDAVETKDCRTCDCDVCGTKSCHHSSGFCQCQPNVIGERCDECLPGFWGFDSCEGCISCNCGIASRSTQCNVKTGQCECAEGVFGRTCNQCKAGYWNYGSHGCEACDCNQEYSIGGSCNPHTGQCECLPGVIGDQCNQCPYRWVLIENTGCRECGICVHVLLDDTEYLRLILDPIVNEMEGISLAHFAYQRLHNINDTVNKLQPLVSLLVYDPSEVDLRPLTNKIENLERDSKNYDRDAKNSLNNAEETTADGKELQEKALELENTLKGTAADVAATVKFVQNLAYQIVADKGPDVDSKIEEAKGLLQQIKQRDFQRPTEKCSREDGYANDTLKRAKQFSLPVERSEQQIEELKDQLAEIKAKLLELMNASNEALEKANQTKDLADPEKYMQLKWKIEAAELTVEGIQTLLTEGDDLVKQARALLNEAKGSLDEILDTNAEKLREITDRLREKVYHLTEDLEDVKPLVEYAKKHAQELKAQADELDSLLADTRESSENAVKAAKSYSNIVEAINDALKAAEAAVVAANQAQNLSEGIDQQAGESEQRSKELLKLAKEAHAKVWPPLVDKLNSYKNGVDIVENSNKLTRDGLEELNRGMARLQIAALRPRAKEAVNKSNEANKKAQKALDTIQGIVDRLDNDAERAEQIRQDIDEANKAIRHAHAQVEKARNAVPEVIQLMGRVNNHSNVLRILGVDVGNKLAELRRKVQLTRDNANRIKVGVSFTGKSYLHLYNPKGLSQSATYNKMSFFLKTKEKKGFIAYVGNRKGTHQQMHRTLTDDFMAVGIRNSQIVLTTDMGSGSNSLVNRRTVSDDDWHQVIIERIGRAVKITVRTENEEEEVVEGLIAGTHTVFNLDQELSKFFVGGIPEGMRLQDEIETQGFVGCIEELTFEDSPVGLWNFISSEFINGCVERDKLVIFKPQTGLRFDGHGYAILNRRSSDQFRKRVEIGLEFRTYARDGLLFLIGKEADFFAIEIREGRIFYQFNLGSGTLALTSKSDITYNDGQWHKLQASRSGKAAILRINGTEVSAGESPGTLEDLSYTDDIYVGGYPGNHSFKGVTNTDFEGCIDHLYIGLNLQDLNKNREALNVVSGCPAKVARTISFTDNLEGYLKMDSVKLFTPIHFTFKFKTKEKDGLILYSSEKNLSPNYIAVALSNGNLKFIMKPGGEVESKGNSTYNDVEWHYVTAAYDGNKLSLHIDDFEDFSETLQERDITFPANSVLHVGGVPYFKIKREFKSFMGCIGDMTVNGVFQNFANTTKRLYGSFASCPLGISSPTPFVTATDIPSETSFTPENGFTRVTHTRPRTRKPTISRIHVSPTPSFSSRECALPRYSSDHHSSLSGFLFGEREMSRHEYMLSDRTLWNTNADIKLDFKTYASSGILFYLTDNRKAKFTALHLKQGKLLLSLDFGSGKINFTSRNKYNDDKWYTVHTRRSGKHIHIEIKGQQRIETINGSITGSMNSDSNSPLFIGGVSEKFTSAAEDNIQDSELSDEACIRDVYLFGNYSKPDMFFTSSCEKNVEKGTYFSGDKSYINLKETFTVGYDMRITMEIKARDKSGILLANHGKKDFLVIQLINGMIKVTVDNGVGAFSINYTSKEDNYFCDGRWHKIQVMKVRNLLMIEVDKVLVGPVSGSSTSLATDTNTPLYIGGIPDTPVKPKGVETSHFVGCMRNFKINDSPFYLETGKKTDGIHFHFCPTN